MKEHKTTNELERRTVHPYSQRLYYWISAFGLNPVRFLYSLRGFPALLREYWTLRRQNKHNRSKYRLRLSMPCPDDRYMPSGKVMRHYFLQDLLIAQKIFEAEPRKHVDVGSRIDGFVAHVASFRDIEVFDIRPMQSTIANVTFRQIDFMKDLEAYAQYCDSLSCLHALEHFGLGRYGDEIDILGYVRGFENLTKMLKKKGTLYLSVPIGPERIDFNAHRVFNIETILSMAKPHYELLSFSYIDDENKLHEGVDIGSAVLSTNLGCYYGCGIFEFRKTR